jgi:hypothetical protein
MVVTNSVLLCTTLGRSGCVREHPLVVIYWIIQLVQEPMHGYAMFFRLY